jgi:hypothetical protein
MPARWYCSFSCFSISAIDFLQLRAGQEALLELVVGDVLLPRRGLAQLREQALPVGGGVGGHLRRRDHGADLRRRRDVEAGFLQRRALGVAGQALLASCASTRSFPARTCSPAFLRLDHHDVDVAAEERREALAAARKGHERPLGAGRVLQRAGG